MTTVLQQPPVDGDSFRISGTYVVRTTSASVYFTPDGASSSVNMAGPMPAGSVVRVFLVTGDGIITTEGTASTAVLFVDPYAALFIWRQVGG